MYIKKPKVLNTVDPVAIMPDDSLRSTINDLESSGIFKLVETLDAIVDEGRPDKKTICVLGDREGDLVETIPIYLEQHHKLDIYVAYATRELPDKHVFGRVDVIDGDQVIAARYYIDREHLEDEELRKSFFTPLTLVSGFASGSQTLDQLKNNSIK